MTEKRRPRRRATAQHDLLAAPVEDDEPQESGPLRRCVVTRERLPKERLIRFVVAPDRSIVPDLAARLPGRGMWLSASGDVIEASLAKGALARAFAKAARGPVVLPQDFVATLEVALVRRIGELLGLARRAGQAVAGQAKAREWARNGRAGLMLEASDGSAAERARLFSGVTALPVLEPLPAAALGQIFGRDHAVHVAIASGKLADQLCVEAGRLDGLRKRRQATAAVREEAGANG